MTRNDCSKQNMAGGKIMENKVEGRGCEGILPCSAPLANPYVPFQLENPPQYEPRKALVRGTLFPGLDLPFMGMINKDEKPVTPLTEWPP